LAKPLCYRAFSQIGSSSEISTGHKSNGQQRSDNTVDAETVNA